MPRTLTLMILLLFAAACAPQAAPPATATTAPAEPAAEPTTPPAAEEPAPAVDSAAAELSALQTITLTNASSGETFTLADFAGKTVLVEPMATWCTNCRAQLGNVIQARNQLDDDFVVVALSVGENITNSDLASYVERQGFGSLIFAIATPEMLSALTDAFGRSALTPPATPHFIIRPDGSTTDLMTGAKNPQTLVSLLNEAAGG